MRGTRKEESCVQVTLMPRDRQSMDVKRSRGEKDKAIAGSRYTKTSSLLQRLECRLSRFMDIRLKNGDCDNIVIND